MKNLLLTISLIIAVVISCKKASNSEGIQLKGRYKGTFQRIGLSAGKIANITVDFSSNTWSGESEFAKYPGLCYGTFKVSQDSITFTNLCPWTAEFDNTLVLAHTYKLETLAETIVVSRRYAGGMEDKYLLKKQ